MKMNRQIALRMLGADECTDEHEIKKLYRALISKVHPDSGNAEGYRYTAQEINEAYEFLSKHGKADKKEKQEKSEKSDKWSAALNESLYAEREILDKVTDENGNLIGIITVAKGKYLYSFEEEFPLFLKSVIKCSEEILIREEAGHSASVNSDIRMKFQAELLYLLAAQFIDPIRLLTTIVKHEISDDGKTLYYVNGMLERSDRKSLPDGSILYPDMIKNHRLYLKDSADNCRGYLSFRDDRLYYSLIPLFEQQRVQIKTIADKAVKYGNRVYQQLNITIRLKDDSESLPENINLRIDELLSRFASGSQGTC